MSNQDSANFMKNPFYSIIKNQSEDILEMLIYGTIGDETTAKKFVEDFQELGKTAKRINIRINSPGGSVWDGLPIFNVIRQFSYTVYCRALYCLRLIR